MRLPERYKQTFYISNETSLNSGEFGTPYQLRGLFIPKGDRTIVGGGVEIQGNTDDLKFESNLKGAELITQNSLIWVKRIPDPTRNYADFTHKVVGRSPTANGWFITIHCESATVDVPIV